MPLPRMFRVRQHFKAPRVEDVAGAVHAELRGLKLGDRIRKDETVAVTAGSRGIANIATVIRAIVEHLKELGARPFIVPAMGSHGGGAAEGQAGILRRYGITEEYTGAEIRASMETVLVATTPEGIPVHFDKHAYSADHVLVCGRVKPHTGFVGPIESGLMKMMLIGLGKHNGAKVYHRAIQDYSFDQIVRSVGRMVLGKCRVVAGLAVVENAYDETALIAAVRPEEFEQREPQLLAKAREWMPRLPFDVVDLLVIDEMGKNISGSGIDTNVVGRKFYDNKAAEDEYPKVKRILVRGLTEETHGNASGIGIADFCPDRLLEQVDWHATWTNVLTGGHPSAGKVPLHYPSDRECIEVALSCVGLVEPEEARVIRITNTLDLGEVQLSEAYLPEARSRDDLTILDEPSPIQLDAAGNSVDTHARPSAATVAASR